MQHQTPETSFNAGSMLLRGAHIVDTRDGSLSRDFDVFINDGVIAKVGPTGTLNVESSTEIDARSKFLVPGYLDMHTHIFNAGDDAGMAADLMLAHGITGFREMASTASVRRKRDDGKLPLSGNSPRLLALASELLTPFTAGTPEAAVKTVREQKDAGADFIKAAFTSVPAFLAAQAEAARLDIPIVGHLPVGIDVTEASAGGMKSIEHLGPGSGILTACSTDGEAIRAELASVPPRRLPPVHLLKIPFLDILIRRRLRDLLTNPALRYPEVELKALQRAVATFDEDRARRLAAQLASDGTWQCVTLIRNCTCLLSDSADFRNDPNLRYLARPTFDRWMESSKEFEALPATTRETLKGVYELYLKVTSLFDADGVKIIAGSDAGGIWDIPGSSLHQEFDELARAGLSPLRVLQATTLNGAEFLGMTDKMGTVEEGKFADLVLLNANPVDDVANLHELAGVVRGKFHSPDELEAIKEKVAARKLPELL